MSEHLIEYFEDSHGNRITVNLLVDDDVFFEVTGAIGVTFDVAYFRVNHETRVVGDKATTRTGEFVKYLKMETINKTLDAIEELLPGKANT